MIDHLGIQCNDVARPRPSTTPCSPARRRAGIIDFGAVIGFGIRPSPTSGSARCPTGPAGYREVHIAFVAADRAAVRAFFDAAVGAGAEVLHEPRVWPEYHPGYYGAFVRDPDGNNVEAVCHRPED